MMASTDYRAKAAELRDQAQRATRPDVKEQLLLMAADWDKLAAKAEGEKRRREDAGDGRKGPSSSR